MRAIFISYRRDDAEGQAGRLFKDLVAHFGPDAVFMDVTGIAAGVDFRNVIEQHVTSCGVLLSLIGKDWLSADESGKRRLDDATDFVRLETASALKRDIPVVPVLVQGARMPRPDQLPADLEALAYRNAVELTHARWDSDVRLLIEALKPHVGGKGSAPPDERAVAPRMKRLAAAAAAAVVLAAALYAWLPRDDATARPENPTDASGVNGSTATAPAARPRPADDPPAAPPAGTPAASTAQASGRMLLYQHEGYRDGSPTWPLTGQEIGAGWNFKQVFAGDGGAIYAIQSDGKMLFYRHRGAEWLVEGVEIGAGWNFKHVFAGDDGAVYAIQDDGKMLFYKHAGVADGSARWPIAGVEIGTGWNFKQVFAGDDGAVYAIQDDGKMLFYKHAGVADGSARWPIAGVEIGTGWNFEQVFAGDGGAVYAIQDDGRMLFYQHAGLADGSASWPVAGTEVGSGWNFRQVFAGNQGLVYAITL